MRFAVEVFVYENIRRFQEFWTWAAWFLFLQTDVLGYWGGQSVAAATPLSGDFILVYKFFDWSTAFGTDVDFIFRFDSTTTLMCFVVYTVWMNVETFLPYYVKNDLAVRRFLTYFPLFTFCMLVMVTAGNVLQFFMGWEAIGLCSYLLINFWYTRVQANKAALKAILVNRIGDFALLCGIILCWLMFESFNIDDIILSAITQRPIPVWSCDTLGIVVHSIDIVCLFFFIAAMSKSAQIGLHTWLPDAMEGPTPVSALIHAATMVTAGIYLLIRFSGVFVLSSGVLAFMSIIGALTAFFAATTALAQSDIKKIIAFSTCSQLGYMVMACGSAQFSVAFFHLLTHAFFKAALFLCAGIIIHTLNGEQDLRRMGGLKKKLPFVYVVMSIASLALAGAPYLSGYYSKDAIIGVLWFQSDWVGYFCGILAVLAAICTSMYSAAIVHHAFLTTPRWNVKTLFALNAPGAYASDVVSHTSIFFLSVLSIFTGYYLRDLLIAPDLDVVIGTYSGFSNVENLLVYFEFAPVWFKFLTLFAGASGFIFYGLQRLVGMPSFVFVFAPCYYTIDLYKFLYYRWCFDLIYSYYIVGFAVRASNLWIYIMLQQQVVDKWFLEVFVSQTEQGGHLAVRSNGVSARAYLRVFVVGFIVYSLIFAFVVHPIDATNALYLQEFANNSSEF